MEICPKRKIGGTTVLTKEFSNSEIFPPTLEDHLVCRPTQFSSGRRSIFLPMEYDEIGWNTERPANFEYTHKHADIDTR